MTAPETYLNAVGNLREFVVVTYFEEHARMGFIVRHFFRLLARLPFKAACAVAGGIIMTRSGLKWGASRSNWETFFGKGDAEQTRYRNWKSKHRRYLARLLVETGRRSFSKVEDYMGAIEVSGEEHIGAAAALGRGSVLLSGHCGAWWMAPLYLAARGHPIVTIAKPVDSSERLRLNQATVDRYGVKLVYRGSGAALAARGALRSNGILYVIGDALTPAESADWYSFGNGAIQMNRGPVVLAARHGSAVLHANCELLPGGKARIEIRPIHLTEDRSLRPDPRELSQRWLEVLSREIAALPEQWWMWRIQKLRAASDANSGSEAVNRSEHFQSLRTPDAG